MVKTTTTAAVVVWWYITNTIIYARVGVDKPGIRGREGAWDDE